MVKVTSFAYEGTANQADYFMTEVGKWVRKNGKLLSATKAEVIAENQGCQPHEVEGTIPWYQHHRQKFMEQGLSLIHI